MHFMDSAGTRYQLTEIAETPAPTKKTPVWPWVVGGLAVAGGLVWMASSSTRKPNPVNPGIEALIVEARDPNTSWARLEELAHHSEREVRRAVLDNPNLCPTDDDGLLYTRLLKALAEEFPEEVANDHLFALHALIEPNNAFEEVVKEVVKRTKDVELIEHVFRTWAPSSWRVRQGIALNSRTPVNLLRIMGNESTEPNDDVRQGVARNPSTPVDVLRTLGNQATEFMWNVRQDVALNPRTPEDVLRLLGNEQTESASTVRQVVASNPRTPEDVLRTLCNEATESDWSVRLAVSKNPNAPVDVLLLGNEKTEPYWRVRQAVAENPNTPEDLLRTLANPATESDTDVRNAAQKALAKRGLA